MHRLFRRPSKRELAFSMLRLVSKRIARSANSVPVPFYLAAASGTGALIGWYWRRWDIPTNEREVELSTTSLPPHQDIADDFEGDRRLQRIDEGYGPLFHRRYYADIADASLSSKALIHHISSNINHFSPQELAIFEKQSLSDEAEDTGNEHHDDDAGLHSRNGHADDGHAEENSDNASPQMHVGDAYYIHIAGPWDGPVRVIEMTPTSFSFMTLEGHLEAGEIQFSVVDHPRKPGALRFEIVSWSRSRDEMVDLSYDKLKVAKTAQTQMWVYFCNQVVEASGGKLMDEIQVSTQKTPYPPQTDAANRTSNGTAHSSPARGDGHSNQAERTPAWKRYSAQLDQYRKADLNFDLDNSEQFTEINGWHIDDYESELPEEQPGKPEERGSFALAKQVLLNYEFPDPSLITGVFVPDDPLEDRVMVLRARFLIFSFTFGVRIGRVVDETRHDEQRGEVQVWGYSYRTLQGHFEMGEILFEILKFADTGEVEFHIHAYSKTGRIGNPFYKIGFALFGRGLQVRFARTAIERMQKIVLERLTAGSETVEKPEVKPVHTDDEAEEELKEVQDIADEEDHQNPQPATT